MVGGQLDDTVAEADVLGPLAGGAKEYLRRRAVRILFQEMMFDFPGVIVAKPIGQFHLVERVVEQPLLVARRPWPGQLQFVKNPELHSRFPP